jgi:hypothetical protein
MDKLTPAELGAVVAYATGKLVSASVASQAKPDPPPAGVRQVEFKTPPSKVEVPAKPVSSQNIHIRELHELDTVRLDFITTDGGKLFLHVGRVVDSLFGAIVALKEDGAWIGNTNPNAKKILDRIRTGWDKLPSRVRERYK